jgi:6-phosphofructokinase
MRIALSTGGGDAPGLNAVIRAAVLSAVNRGWEVLGIKGYAGLLGEEEVIPMLAVRFGGAAVRAVADKKWDHMIALQSPHIVTVPLADVLKTPKRVEIDHDTVLTARATGICFGG